MTAKADLRRKMRAVIAAIPAQEAERQAEMAAERLAEWPVYRRAGCVLLYASLPGELDTAPMLDRALADGKRLLLPRCGADGEMRAVRVEDLRGLCPGRFGIREPSAALPAEDPQAIDLVLAPGLAFDGRGTRLGRGKGFFDRFLLRTRAVAAGVAYLEQILPDFPAQAREPHDVWMDFLVTARGVLPARRGCKNEGGGAR
ncbi:MAG: 5-formyltetrahydrofolate cyclo-ligase [Clostridia bacterium]|nr:5-formyltetrahydrofolate cyclo-ligase [Clostridia bacterium]